MAQKKKSFTNDLNPVFDFISIPQEEKEQNEQNAHQEAEEQPARKDQAKKKQTAQAQTETAQQTTQSEGEGTATPPTGYKVNPFYVEVKSKRLQLLIKPSTHEAIKKKAAELGTSTNALINEVLENYFTK